MTPVPLRVMMWSELFWPYIGGAEQFGARLIASLQRRGVEFLVVTSHENLDLPDRMAHEGISIRRFPLRRALRERNPRVIHELRNQIRDVKRTFAPDLVHVNAIGPSVLFHLHTQRDCVAPSLVRLQQEVLPSEINRNDSLLFHALASAGWVVGCSDAVLGQATGLAPSIAARSSTIRNGISNVPDYPPPLPSGAPRLVCLGRLVHAKGFETAITATAILMRRFPSLRLDIAGDGAERPALEQRVRDLGLQAAVRFLGWIDPSGVADVLTAATIVLLPSCREGLPAVAVQAAAMARPVVATAVGGVPEIVVDNETGFLVPQNDSAALADAVAVLLENPALATRFGHAGYHRVRAQFGWNECVDAYDALYYKLTGRHDVTAESARHTQHD